MSYALCPTCSNVISVQRVDNGVGLVWHAVHCGFGHDSFERIYPDEESAREAIPVLTARQYMDMALDSDEPFRFSANDGWFSRMTPEDQQAVVQAFDGYGFRDLRAERGKPLD